MARLLGDTVLRALDANGEAVSGARMTVFVAGTTTPMTAYSDVALTTAHASPIVADSSGVFPPVYVILGPAKVRVETPDGALLPGYPVDYVPAFQSDGGSETLGAAIITPTGGVADSLADHLGLALGTNTNATWDGFAIWQKEDAREFVLNTDETQAVNFGIAGLRVREANNPMAIVGEVVQANTPGTWGFPAGITGYGALRSAGNQAFGVFGRADAYTAGTATNELNSFNYSAGPPGTFPPVRSFGIANTIPITLTIAAGGDHQSLIGVHIASEGAEPQDYVCGIYSNPTAITDFGIFIDASATDGPVISGLFKNTGGTSSHIALEIQLTTASPSGLFMACKDNDGDAVFAVRGDGRTVHAAANTQTSVGAAGAATVLPTNPTGYLRVEVGGLPKVIPYYEAS